MKARSGYGFKKMLLSKVAIANEIHISGGVFEKMH